MQSYWNSGCVKAILKTVLNEHARARDGLNFVNGFTILLLHIACGPGQADKTQ